jgi:hypothetical protein
MLGAELNWYLPVTEEDALRGSPEGAFVTEPQWLSCYDPDLPPLMPGERTPVVLALDAGVTNDLFAIVAVTRHPVREADPAVRAVKVFTPPKGGEIDFSEVEDFVRLICMGGCYAGHPNRQGALSAGMMCARHPESKHLHQVGTRPCEGEGIPCPACAGGERVERHNVVQIAYDAYQLVDMAQKLHRDRIAWCFQFPQGSMRMEADANLRNMVIQRRLAHRNDDVLNQHIRNAIAKINPQEDNKLRIVKRAPGSKIDLAVALSMAVSRVLYLNLRNPK